MTLMQQHDDRQQAVARISAIAEQMGRFSTATHELTLQPNSPEIHVRDLRTSRLVAYSSTKADYDQSLAEFVFDYLV